MNEDEIKIDALLNSFLKKNNLEKGLEKVDAKDAWFKIMKNGVSNYTTDIHLKNKTLYVSLSSSTLREELSYGKEKIIKIIIPRKLVRLDSMIIPKIINPSIINNGLTISGRIL